MHLAVSEDNQNLDNTLEALRFRTASLIKCQQRLIFEGNHYKTAHHGIPHGDLLVVDLMISNFGKILSDGSKHCVSVEVFPHSEFDVAGKAGQGCNSVVFFHDVLALSYESNGNYIDTMHSDLSGLVKLNISLDDN